jgi:hypothetical protein
MMGGFALISFFWVIPLFLVTGGIIPYIHYLSEAASSMRNGAHPSFIEVGKTLAKGFVLTLGLGIIFPFLFLLTNRFKLKKKKYKKLSLFFLFWIIPPFLFNLLIRSDHAGYQLPYLVPLLILCAASLFSLFRKSYYLRFFLIAMVCVNFILFFRNRDINNKNPYIPTSFHYSEILKNDKKMDEKINYIKDNFEPKTTLIVIGDPNYFRPVMYYFPEFNTIQINKLTSKDSNYSNLIREGYQYKMREYKTFKNYYKLKDSISSIVCFDDDCRNWVNKNSNTISFDKYTFIVEIIKNKSNLYYDFGKLTLQ